MVSMTVTWRRHTTGIPQSFKAIPNANLTAGYVLTFLGLSGTFWIFLAHQGFTILSTGDVAINDTLEVKLVAIRDIKAGFEDVARCCGSIVGILLYINSLCILQFHFYKVYVFSRAEWPSFRLFVGWELPGRSFLSLFTTWTVLRQVKHCASRIMNSTLSREPDKSAFEHIVAVFVHAHDAAWLCRLSGCQTTCRLARADTGVSDFLRFCEFFLRLLW